MRELASGVLQEELALDKKRRAKYVRKQNEKRRGKHRPIGVEQNTFVRSHEPKFAKEPEPIGKENRDGDEQRVRNHRLAVLTAGSARNSLFLRAQAGTEGSPQQPRLSPHASFVLRATSVGMGCRDCGEQERGRKTEVARRGGTLAAGRTPATPFSACGR